MAFATKEQLIERWLTPEGKKVKKQIIEHIREKNWEKFLVGFPFIEEVENGRDLRFINLKGADLSGTHFEGADLWGAIFEGADLWGAHFEKADFEGTHFEGANLGQAHFERVNLGKAHFEKANLWGAHFERVNLEGTHFERVNLSGAIFEGADLEGTHFEEAYLWEAIFNNCSIMNIKFLDCTFDEITFYYSKIANVDWCNSNIKKRYFKNLKPFEQKDGSKDYIGLMETYISLKNQFNKNGLYNDMSWAYLKEKESLRLHYKQNITYKEINVRDRTKSFFKYIWDYILFFLFGYGERPWHILGWSVFAIIIFGLIYKITNAVGSSLQDIDTTVTFWRSLYFSTITFTTVGFGDFHPLRDIPRILVMSEAALGLFFYSLFIFTFGRRIAGR